MLHFVTSLNNGPYEARLHWTSPHDSRSGSVSYIVSILIDNGGKWPVMLLQKCFGNGVRAEDWLLEEMSNPVAWLMLKYPAQPVGRI